MATALHSMNVASCVAGAPPRSVHVSLTFAPTGAVTTAVIDAGNEALTEAERTCVTRRELPGHPPSGVRRPAHHRREDLHPREMSALLGPQHAQSRRPCSRSIWQLPLP